MTIDYGGAPESGARADYLSALREGTSVTWYTTKAEFDPFIKYVVGLHSLDRFDLLVSDSGFYFDGDHSVMMMGITGPWGSGLTLWALNSAGIDRVNEAIDQYWGAMKADMAAGRPHINPVGARYAVVVEGSLDPEFAGSSVMGYIEDSLPLHLWGSKRVD